MYKKVKFGKSTSCISLLNYNLHYYIKCFYVINVKKNSIGK